MASGCTPVLVDREGYPGHVGWFSWCGASAAGINHDIPWIALLRDRHGRLTAHPALFCVQVQLRQLANQVQPEMNWPPCWWYGWTVPDKKPVIVSWAWQHGEPDQVQKLHRQWFQVQAISV